MTDAIVKVMVEVLNILAIATKEVNQHHASESIVGDISTISTYFSSETFLKMLVGRKDVEDALQRLEEVTSEEVRMAAVEALKAIHGVGAKVGDTLKAMEDRMRGMEGMLLDVGNRLKGVDDRVRVIGGKVINSAQTVPLVIKLLSLFILLGAEETGLQAPSDFDAVATTHGIDGKVRRIYDMQGGVYNRAMDVDAVRNAVQDIGARVVGEQIIHGTIHNILSGLYIRY